MKEYKEIIERIERLEIMIIGLKSEQEKLSEISRLDNEPHLTIKQAARFLKVTHNTIHQWSNKGLIKKRRIKGTDRVYFLKAELIKLMK